VRRNKAYAYIVALIFVALWVKVLISISNSVGLNFQTASLASLILGWLTYLMTAAVYNFDPSKKGKRGIPETTLVPRKHLYIMLLYSIVCVVFFVFG